MRPALLAVLTLICTLAAAGQNVGQWTKTSYRSSPSASRLNDGFFLTPSLGWVVNGIGQIHRTTDGGATWTKQFDDKSFTHFRSVGFFDSLNGYAGALGFGDVNNPSAKDTVILYKTTNGGANWIPESQLTSGTIKRGFCGMQVMGDSIINAVGRVRGPAYFYRTTDRGATWTATDMSAYAGGLVDVFFFSRDTGFVVGLSNSVHEQSHGIILKTVDGGATWDTSYYTSRNNEWCWKIVFPSRMTGYVSLQRNNNVTPVFIIKTTDGGATWHDKLFRSTAYFVQGIGFINDSTGWLGGNSASPPYQTTDGGDTWTARAIGNQLNRFRFLNDTVGYVVGDAVYKYTVSTATAVARNTELIPREPLLGQNYPNPFNPKTRIDFTIPQDGNATISIYDSRGAWVRTLLSGDVKKGSSSVSWDGLIESGEEAASGTYFYRLEMNGHSESKKMVLLR